jgi:hypothetical protein
MKKKKKKARAGEHRSSPSSKAHGHQDTNDAAATLVLPKYRPTSPSKETKLSSKINSQQLINFFVESMNSIEEFMKFPKMIGQGYNIYLVIVDLWKLIPSWFGKHWTIVILSWFSQFHR